jgi:hypothetical protein
MKMKNLKKKIRSLEARLKKDTKKLTKLKRKLGAATTAGAGRNKKKSGAHKSRKGSARTHSAKGRATKTPTTPAAGKGQSAAKKVKKKLNLSPERRAQLAAAMKARWAAKRAAAVENPQDATADRDFTLGQVPQTPLQM